MSKGSERTGMSCPQKVGLCANVLRFDFAVLLRCYHRVFQHANLLNLNPHGVAGFEKTWRITEYSYSSGCAGGNHVPRLERENMREVVNQVIHIKNEMTGVRVLHLLSADNRMDLEHVRIGNLVAGDDRRTEGRECIE